MGNYFSLKSNKSRFDSGESWTIMNDIEARIKAKIEAKGTPLKDWDINIYRGVLTGYNEAFIIDGKKKDELIAQDPKSAEIIRPILRGRDIKRYKAEFADLYILFVPWHFPLHKDPKINGASLKAEKAFEEQYPAIYNHLLKFKDALSARNKAETGIRYEWYALQRCANTYYEEFEKEKIVWGNIAYDAAFCLVPRGVIINAPANLITSSTVSLKFLIAVMNSKIFDWEFKNLGIDLGSAFEWKKQYVENIHIPRNDIRLNDTLSKYIVGDNINESLINTEIYNYYQLDNEEITIIEQS